MTSGWFQPELAAQVESECNRPDDKRLAGKGSWQLREEHVIREAVVMFVQIDCRVLRGSMIQVSKDGRPGVTTGFGWMPSIGKGMISHVTCGFAWYLANESNRGSLHVLEGVRVIVHKLQRLVRTLLFHGIESMDYDKEKGMGRQPLLLRKHHALLNSCLTLHT